ncbi:MAG: hypothetical protein QOD35_1931, partial [Nocardioidaceae bacterium]|nr:hypothetical protein [Nocardioidaceae bacterium]
MEKLSPCCAPGTETHPSVPTLTPRGGALGSARRSKPNRRQVAIPAGH